MQNDVKTDLKKIYDGLSDNLSRYIFINRLLYNITGDSKYVKKLIKKSPFGKEFCARLNNALARKDKICIFGAGIRGQHIKNDYADVNFHCFIDNNNKNNGKVIDGIPVLSFNDWIKNSSGTTVIISSQVYFNEMYDQLITNNYPDKHIINFGEYLHLQNKEQYFDLPALKRKRCKEETFLDGGCFDGMSSYMFYKWHSEKTNCKSKILAFEGDPNHHDRCYINLNNTGTEYKLFNIGLWKNKDILNFASNLKGSSHITLDDVHTQNTVSIEVNSLDNLIDEKVTFIKLDIEGAELQALEGAKNLIRKYKPKLAISVYHKRDDIYNIPKLVLNLVPEYKLWLRHYSLLQYETILYCIC